MDANAKWESDATKKSKNINFVIIPTALLEYLSIKSLSELPNILALNKTLKKNMFEYL